MERFYKINDSKIIQFGFNTNINVWYCSLIDLVDKPKKITTISNAEKAKLVADVVKQNWFMGNITNFSLFIEDVIKL